MSANDIVAINAIIAIIVSAIGSFLSYLLAIKKSEIDAHRDYVYSARKKLYENYEPLVFQFHQLCESAYERIIDLAKNLRKERRFLFQINGEKNEESTYILNTVYRILAPLVIFKLMERKLTQFDLELDEEIKNEYLFAKALYNLLRNDELFVVIDQRSSPEVHHGQAIHSSELDKMCEALLNDTTDKTDGSIIKSLAKFTEEASYPYNKESFRKIFKLFTDFSPSNSMVFWVNLLAYAYICRAICTISKNSTEINYRLTLGKYTVPVDDFFWEEIFWDEYRAGREKMSYIISQSFEHAKKRLQSTLKGPFDN